MTRAFYRFGKGSLSPKSKSVPVMAAMPVMTMVPMAAVVPSMVPVPAAMTVPAMVMPPTDLRRGILSRLLGGRRSGGIKKRYRLGAIGRRRNHQQTGNGRKSENRSNVHLHELSPSVSELKRSPAYRMTLQQAKKSEVNAR